MTKITAPLLLHPSSITAFHGVSQFIESTNLIGLGGFLVLLHGRRDLLQPGLDGHQHLGKSLRDTPRYVRLRSCERLHIRLALLLGAVQAVEGRPEPVPSPGRTSKRWKAVQERGKGGGLRRLQRKGPWVPAGRNPCI